MKSDQLYFDPKAKKFVCIRRGPFGGYYTLYKSPDPHKKRGTRVKAKNDLPHAVEKAWFAAPEDAEKGLAAYAQQNRWPLKRLSEVFTFGSK